MDAGTIQNWYKDCNSYMNAMKFNLLFPKCERFYSGDQWAPPTQKTKDFPRPVINVVEFINNHKVSAIINDPVKMVFSPDDQDEQDELSEVAAELFSQYSSTEWENVEQDELNEDAVLNASNYGAGIWHYYWDADVTLGKNRVVKGKLCGEVLNPRNVLVGNPQDVRTQTQPFILVIGRKNIAEVRKEALGNNVSPIVVEEIKPDKDTKYESNSTNEIGEKATVITAYWKELIPPFAYPTVQLMKICGITPVKPKTNTGKKLYPIVKMNWFKKDECWYGRGQTEGLINNQKLLNYMVAIQAKSAEATGMPKLMLKEGLTSWNTDPSQAVKDNTPAPGWGASYLQPASISNAVPNLVDFVNENMKSLSGAGETSTGDLPSLSNISPTVVLSLQQQAQVPTESMKKRYKRAMKEVGEIWQEFWTQNYNTTRVITIDKLNPATGQEEKLPQDFKGTDFQNANLKLKIDIGTSQSFSDQLVTTTLDQLYKDKIIDGKTKVEFYPESAMPFKNELLKKLEQQPQLPMPPGAQVNIQPNMQLPQAPQQM